MIRMVFIFCQTGLSMIAMVITLIRMDMMNLVAIMKTINIFKTFLLSLLLTFGLGVQAQVTSYPHTSDFEGSLGDWVNVQGDNKVVNK